MIIIFLFLSFLMLKVFFFFFFVKLIWCEMVWDALGVILLLETCLSVAPLWWQCCRDSECESQKCPSVMGSMGRWRSQASMLSPSQCVSKSMEGRASSIHYNSISVGRRFTGSSSLTVSLCVYVETVILGRGSLGFAGSAHWTKSSSGGRLESLPS